MDNSVDRNPDGGIFLASLIPNEFLANDNNLPEMKANLQIVKELQRQNPNMPDERFLLVSKSKMQIAEEFGFISPHKFTDEIGWAQNMLNKVLIADLEALNLISSLKNEIGLVMDCFRIDAGNLKKIDLKPLREKIQQEFDDGNFRVAQICHEILGMLGGEMEIDFEGFENSIYAHFDKCRRNLSNWDVSSIPKNYQTGRNAAEEIKAGLEMLDSNQNNFELSDEGEDDFCGIDLGQLQRLCDSKNWNTQVGILPILLALDAEKAPNLDLTNFAEMAEEGRDSLNPTFKDFACVLKNFGQKVVRRRLNPDDRNFFRAENLGIKKAGDCLILQLKFLKEFEYEIPNFVNNKYFDFLQSALEAGKYNIFWEGMQVVECLQKPVGQKYQKTFAPHLNKCLAFVLSGNKSDYYLENYPEVFLLLAKMIKAHAPETANFIKEILFIGNSEKTQKALQVVEAKLHKSLGKKILTKLVNLFGGRAAEVSEK